MSARILVIDDDPMVLRSVERTLVRGGYDVVAVGSPAAAIAALLDPGRFAAVVSDVDLGAELTGFDLAEIFAGKVPTVLMSGLVTAEREAEARRHGVLALLAKPLDIDEIVRLLAGAMGDVSPSARSAQ